MSAKKVHVKIAESSDPEHTYVEKIHTPRRRGSQSDSGTTEQEWSSMKHAHVDSESADPEHTYVEKIHTPRRKASQSEAATAEEWDSVRHAHIDDDAASPHGLVDRKQTPLRPRNGPEESSFPPAPQAQQAPDDAAQDPLLPLNPPTGASSPSACPFAKKSPSAADSSSARCPFSGKQQGKSDGSSGKCPMLYVSAAAGVIAIVAFLLMEKRALW